MFLDMFGKLPVKVQGYLALALGIILILVGALSDLKIIEYMLKIILIALGIVFAFWGFKKASIMDTFKSLTHKK